MKKIFRILSLAFALALLPVAFHGDEQAPLGAAVGIQDACARGRGGNDCEYTGNWRDKCWSGPERIRFHRSDAKTR